MNTFKRLRVGGSFYQSQEQGLNDPYDCGIDDSASFLLLVKPARMHSNSGKHDFKNTLIYMKTPCPGTWKGFQVTFFCTFIPQTGSKKTFFHLTGSSGTRWMV